MGRFLELAGISLATGTWLDSLFRRLRRLAGLGLCLCVLLTAETIGMVYYLALRRATGSSLLRRLCDQLLRDEVRHLHFHAECLASMRQHRSRWRNWWSHTWHRMLLTGVCSFLGFRSYAVEGKYIFNPERILAGKEYYRLVSSAFDDAPRFHHQNLFRPADSRETMRDDESRAATHQETQAFLYCS